MLVGLEPGGSESTDAWAGFLDGMVARGLCAPLLVISDGAPGLIATVELVFPHSLRQRCLIHYAEQRVMPSWEREPLRDRDFVLLKSA